MRCTHSCDVFVDENIFQVHGTNHDLVDGGAYPWKEVHIHDFRQDESSPAWQALLKLVEDAAEDGRESFSPEKSLGPEIWSQITTLPSTVSKLVEVKKLDLYGSNLLCIPPEIGEMRSLVDFAPYTSYGLHWFPYEITWCTNLRSSSVSTRALYGNYKYRPPFPKLNTREVIETIAPKYCSVCNTRLNPKKIKQVWVSHEVATDVLPLLVNACSQACINNLEEPPDDYIKIPHEGGLGEVQPQARFSVRARK